MSEQYAENPSSETDPLFDDSNVVDMEEYRKRKRAEILLRMGEAAMDYSSEKYVVLDHPRTVHDYPNGDITITYDEYNINTSHGEYDVPHQNGKSGKRETKSAIIARYFKESNEITTSRRHPRNDRYAVLDKLSLKEREDWLREYHDFQNRVKSKPPQPKNYDP